MDNQPSFAERAKRLRETAYKLREASEIVLSEVQHMEAAAKRFQGGSQMRDRKSVTR